MNGGVVRRVSALTSGLRGGPRLVTPQAERVLVVAPHPDDEVLMCGGTIARLTERGAHVTVAFASDGEATLAPGGRRWLARRRRAETHRAAAVLGISAVRALGHPDGGLAQAHGLPHDLADLLAALEPDLVLTPWRGDHPGDHAAVAHAVGMALSARRGPLPRIWAGEVWTPLSPSIAVDVTAVRARQRAALACHRTPATVRPLSAGLALHDFRGWQTLGGNGACEAFAEQSPESLIQGPDAPG